MTKYLKRAIAIHSVARRPDSYPPGRRRREQLLRGTALGRKRACPHHGLILVSRGNEEPGYSDAAQMQRAVRWQRHLMRHPKIKRSALSRAGIKPRTQTNSAEKEQRGGPEHCGFRYWVDRYSERPRALYQLIVLVGRGIGGVENMISIPDHDDHASMPCRGVRRTPLALPKVWSAVRGHRRCRGYSSRIWIRRCFSLVVPHRFQPVGTPSCVQGTASRDLDTI